MKAVIRNVPCVVLGLTMLTNFSRGSIHAFAPDGGAHSIAGLDLSTARQTILSLFALMGFHQFVTGGFQLYVLALRRDLVLLALVLQTMETLLGVVNLYFYRTLPVAVPGAPFNAAVLVVLAVAVLIAARSPTARA
ncbi:MAG: hypothetical protein WA740_15455 [Candidatus Binataceae bacterium]